jgi:HAD superfamily hydrolase (TIGR01509 family)
MTRRELFSLHLSPDFPEEILRLVQKHGIKMVYWDFGGTMVDISPAVKERAVRKINMTYHRDIDLQKFNQAIRVEWGRREHRESNAAIKSVNNDTKEKAYWIEFYTCVLKNLGIRVKGGQIVKWLATMQANPKSFERLPFIDETLALLVQTNIQIGIISNAFPSAKRILKDKGLSERFDEQHIIWSYEYNSVKPERDIYQEGIIRAGVKPYEILFIDDRKSFVEGAAEHGMKVAIINDTEGEDVNGTGKSKSEVFKPLKHHILNAAWFWNRWLKGNRNRLARLVTGFLCHLKAPGYLESLLPRPEM